jgi:hypothetical protein
MALTLEFIKSRVEDLATKIAAPQRLLPSYGQSTYGPTNYITIGRKGELTYVASGDRGNDTYIEAVDLNHLLFIVFKNVTASMAMDLYLKNPQPTVDNRRQRFKIQLGLLEKLNKEWKIWQEQDQENLSVRFPLNDYQGKRQSYFRELLGNGFLYKEALEKAYQKYP